MAKQAHRNQGTNGQRRYTGYSGQMAVMAELLFRRCNVSVPVVDVGLDVFAFHEDHEEVARIQVKTGQGKRYKGEEGSSVKFDVPMRQLRHPDRPGLVYVLAARVEGRFLDFLIISRAEMRGFWIAEERFGTENDRSGNLVLTIQFRPHQVLCGEVVLTAYRNAWERLPPLRPRPDNTADLEGPEETD